jgi:hypothetical protein
MSVYFICSVSGKKNVRSDKHALRDLSERTFIYLVGGALNENGFKLEGK